MRKPLHGPRYAAPSYTIRVRGEHGCSVYGDPIGTVAQIACYLESRPNGVVDVTYSEHCAHCRGNGRVPGKRRMSWLPCKVCAGEPDLFALEFTQDDIKALRRRYQSAWLAA